MRILVSGASSPLGRLLCAELDRPGVEVRTLDDDPRGRPAARLAPLLDGVDVVVETGVAGTAAEYAPGGRAREAAAGPDSRAVALLSALPVIVHQPPARFVLASTGSVYGASARNPALFGEDHSGARVSLTVADRYRDRYSEPSAQGLAELPAAAEGISDLGAHRLGAAGSSAAAVTLERYARGAARRCPATAFTLLRLAEVVGPTSRTAFADLLRAPVVPMVAGYDPRLSLLHEDDAAAVLALVARQGVPSSAPGRPAGRVEVLNVAGLGAVTMSALAHSLGRVRVFLPGPLLRPGPFGTGVPPALRALLTHGRCLDVGRLGELLGATPARSGQQVVGALAADRATSVAGLARGLVADVVGGLAPAGWGALAELVHRRGPRP